MKEKVLQISDAAREVHVETHVLRYWEEELQLPIKRNELGHRYYTREDVERFRMIKGMKDKGLQLKAIRTILQNGNRQQSACAPETANAENADDAGQAVCACSEQGDKPEPISETREEKAQRLQWILTQLIRQTMQENNEELVRSIRDSVVKELDYQFRMQEEREEKRESLRNERSEEYYRKLDELLRSKKPASPKPVFPKPFQLGKRKKALPKTS